MRDLSEIIKEWSTLAEEGEIDEFLDFAEGMNISGFAIENGVRTIWIADGMHYIADGYAIRETDSENAKYIINTLESCGVEFEGVQNDTIRQTYTNVYVLGNV